MAVLRSVIAAIDNAEAIAVDDVARPASSSSDHVAGASAGVGSAEAERRELTEADLRTILRSQIDERFDGAEQYETLGRRDAADRLRREANRMLRYLSPPAE